MCEEFPTSYLTGYYRKFIKDYSLIAKPMNKYLKKDAKIIVWATKYFRPYLFGRKFIIETDHKPLPWLFSVKEPSSKLVRWRLKLSEYDYEIKYKKGTKNGNADALSRIEPESVDINALESGFGIKETESPINIFKNQIIIRKISSGAARIKNEKIFKNTRKTIGVKELDRETSISLLKNYFDSNKLNAVIVEDFLT